MFVSLLLLAAAFGRYTSAVIIPVGIGGDIQAALNNATANDIISLANGSYTIASPLTVSVPNIGIVGSGGTSLNFNFTSDECMIKSTEFGLYVKGFNMINIGVPAVCPMRTPYALQGIFMVNLITPAVTNNTINIDMDVGMMYQTRRVTDIRFGNCTWANSGSVNLINNYVCISPMHCSMRAGYTVLFSKLADCGVSLTQVTQFNIYTVQVEAQFAEYVAKFNATKDLRIPTTRTASALTLLRINIDRVKNVTATINVKYGDIIPDCVLVSVVPRRPPLQSTMVVNCTVDPPIVPPGTPTPPPPPRPCVGSKCPCVGPQCAVCSGSTCYICNGLTCTVCTGTGPCGVCLGSGCPPCTGNTCPNPTCVGVDCPCFGSNCPLPICTGSRCILCNGTDCNVCIGDNCTVCTGSSCPPCSGSTCPNPTCLSTNITCPCVGPLCPKPICDGTKCTLCNGTSCQVCVGSNCTVCTGTSCPPCIGSLCPNPNCTNDCPCYGTKCPPPPICGGKSCSTCNGTMCTFCSSTNNCFNCTGTACPPCAGSSCPNPTCTDPKCPCYGGNCPPEVCKNGTCTTCTNTSCVICNTTTCIKCNGTNCAPCVGEFCPNPTCTGPNCPCYGQDCGEHTNCTATVAGSPNTTVNSCNPVNPQCNNLTTSQRCTQSYSINMTSCDISGNYQLVNIPMLCQASSALAGLCPTIAPNSMFPAVQLSINSRDLCRESQINITAGFVLDIVLRRDANYTDLRLNNTFILGERGYWSIRIWTNLTKLQIKEAEIIAAVRRSSGNCNRKTSYQQYFSVIGNTLNNSQLTYVTDLSSTPPMIHFNLPISTAMACSDYVVNTNYVNFTYTVQVDYVDGSVRRRRNIPISNALNNALNRVRRRTDTLDVMSESIIKQSAETLDVGQSNSATGQSSLTTVIVATSAVVGLLCCCCSCGIVGALVLRRRRRQQKQRTVEQGNHSQMYAGNSSFSLTSGNRDMVVAPEMLARYPGIKNNSGI